MNLKPSYITCIRLLRAVEILYQYNRFSNDAVMQGIHFNLCQTRLVALLTQKLFNLV